MLNVNGLLGILIDHHSYHASLARYHLIPILA